MGGGWTYGYDAENRLMTAANGSTVAATYAYDPLGRRTKKSGTGVATTVRRAIVLAHDCLSGSLLNDGADEIADYDGSGTVLRRFVPGPAINESVAYENCAGATAPNCTGAGMTTEYFHTDHHGSVVATSGANAASIEGPFTYDAFGAGAPLTGEPFKYVGMYLDAESGLYFDRARYYSAALGRFLQTDPIGYKDNLDLYTYVGDDPTNATDPTGELCVYGLNYYSSLCGASRYYDQVAHRPAVASRTTFYEAASYIADAIGSKDIPVGGPHYVGGSNSQYLDSLAGEIEQHNLGMLGGLMRLPSGGIVGNDTRLVTSEQTFVQGKLDAFAKSSPAAFKSFIGQMNGLLNDTSLNAANPTVSKALGEVRQSLGRNIDYGNKSDRIAIGNQVMKDIRATQVCTGSRIPGNCYWER